MWWLTCPSIYQSISQSRDQSSNRIYNVVLFNHNIILGPPPSFRATLLCPLHHLWHHPCCMKHHYFFSLSNTTLARVFLLHFLLCKYNWFSFIFFQVSVPCTSLFKTVTVRCGHCTNLLPVNMRALLLPSPNQFHLGHSFFSPTHHNLLVILSFFPLIFSTLTILYTIH